MAWLAVGLFLFAGCSSDSGPVPPTPLEAPGSVFYEPPAVCFDGATADTLTAFNLGDTTLVWTVLHQPAGLTGVEARFELDALTARAFALEWSPGGPFPVIDSLVAETNDPLHPRVTVPLRAEDAAGFVDVTAPAAPLLAFPAEGDTVFVDTEFIAEWSRVDDCSGISHYRLEISPTADFRSIVCCQANLTTTAAGLIPDASDVGRGYWRVYAVDNEGLRGATSEVRSWVVVDN